MEPGTLGLEDRDLTTAPTPPLVPIRVFKNTFGDRVPGPMTSIYRKHAMHKGLLHLQIDSTIRNTEMCLVRSCSAVDPP